MTTTEATPKTDRRIDVYKNLEMVGASVPDHEFAKWDDDMLDAADEWAIAKDLANWSDGVRKWEE